MTQIEVKITPQELEIYSMPIVYIWYRLKNANIPLKEIYPPFLKDIDEKDLIVTYGILDKWYCQYENLLIYIWEI